MSGRRYVNANTTPLMDSVGSSLSSALPTPGSYIVTIVWNVESLYKVKDVSSGREWKLHISAECVEGIRVGDKAKMVVGLSPGVIIFHNAGRYSARTHPEENVVLEDVSFEEIVGLFKKRKHKASVPIVESLVGIHEGEEQ